MSCTAFDLREKDVINVCNGQKLGCVTDLEIDTDCGKIIAIIVTGESLTAMIFSKNRVRIPWDKIQRIGKDTILVDMPMLSHDKCDDCESDLKCKSGDRCSSGKRPRWWG